MIKKPVWILFSLLTGVSLSASLAMAADPPAPSLSDDSEACLGCHSMVSPGIVSDWRRSRHAMTSIEQALQRPEQQRRISIPLEKQKTGSQGVAVGCAECHTLNPKSHRDTFDHNGYEVHIVVSPMDCAFCHATETRQYTSGNKMAHAYGILHDNSLYRMLQESVIGMKTVQGSSLITAPSSLSTQMDTCYGCHGTHVQVLGTKEIETPMGPMEVPDLAGWPNMGVGRINPDGSLGSCSPCHPRHAFSIAAARQPQVCSQCHLEPDAPAWNVYKESKHGNLYSSMRKDWDFHAVPWKLGEDFHAPTCAVCHASLLVDPDGAVIVERTHGYTDRLWTRIFGLIYSHPQPIKPDTSIIRNADGIPLPVTFSGRNAGKFLINAEEQDRRKNKMMSVCQGCHSTHWVQLHFKKFDGTLNDVNRMVRVSTQLMEAAWEKGLAGKANPFDEPLELLWTRQWLFYANSIRYASAMTGAPDYAAFHNGWWYLSEGMRKLNESISKAETTK